MADKLLRGNGPGSKVIAVGTESTGYYGKVTNIITGNDLKNLVGLGYGNLSCTNNTGNTISTYGDITWLKFRFNYKTLFIADRVIISNMSWNDIDTANLISGKYININGVRYLVRTIQGASSNPCITSSEVNPTDMSIIGNNSEWYNLIVKFTPDTLHSNWKNMHTICQETNGFTDGFKVLCGYSSVTKCTREDMLFRSSNMGWRPVLEVL